MAQIPEATDEKSEAYKADYKTIAEIGKERIRRAGEKIKEDNADKEGIDDLDVGFRVLKVDSSNMKDVYFSPDNTSQDDMFDMASNIKDDRTDEDLLFMVLLDWGIDLSVKIERKEIAGKTVYFADDNFLAACFEENLDENFVKALVVQQPLKVVLRDSGFASSSVKINVEQIFKQADIEVKVI
jgi:adenine-specific DNA-methyltransferase